ncbi:MAG: hemerythrin domain-containing protein [Deltaproteobacteria bacterium]|nr:hemerythrin domain-containing protein [Deltaproteobacteria bacterium]
MSRIDDLKRAHEELLKIAGEVSAMLYVSTVSEKSDEIGRLLSALLGKLNFHLMMEDKHLYPDLLEHKSEAVRRNARDFSDEMGGIATIIHDYREKWTCSNVIKVNPEEFISETKGVFDALAKRIAREDNELYPLVEKTGF